METDGFRRYKQQCRMIRGTLESRTDSLLNDLCLGASLFAVKIL